MFAIFTAGTTIGPAISGLSFDRFHSYGPILITFEVALAITCALFVRLGPYPYLSAQARGCARRGSEGGGVTVPSASPSRRSARKGASRIDRVSPQPTG